MYNCNQLVRVSIVSLLLIASPNIALAKKKKANCDSILPKSKLLFVNNSDIKVEAAFFFAGSFNTLGVVKPKSKKVFPNVLPTGLQRVGAFPVGKSKGFDTSEKKSYINVIGVNNLGTSIAQCNKKFRFGVNNKLLNIKKLKKGPIPPSRFGGTWKTNFGTIVFAQFDNATVSATYFWSGGGTLKGKVVKDVMTGRYSDLNGSGKFGIKMSDDERSFAGSFTSSTGQRGAWVGSR